MRILVVDDHAILRKGLIAILRKDLYSYKFTEASDGIEALSILRKENIDLVLSDIAMPKLNGIDLIKQLKSLSINTPVIILTMQPIDQYGLRALKAGAFGFLSKNCKPEELISAMEKVLTGKKYITPSISDLLVDSLETPQSEIGHKSLSDRELLVLQYIAKGFSLSEISKDLSLSVNTISTYKSRILKKLGLKNNSDIIRYAIDNKLDYL